MRRQKAIDIGKASEDYKTYLYQVPKRKRESYMPRTPNKYNKWTRRAWDGTIKRWKVHIHNWDQAWYLFISICCATMLTQIFSHLYSS